MLVLHRSPTYEYMHVQAAGPIATNFDTHTITRVTIQSSGFLRVLIGQIPPILIHRHSLPRAAIKAMFLPQSAGFYSGFF